MKCPFLLKANGKMCCEFLQDRHGHYRGSRCVFDIGWFHDCPIFDELVQGSLVSQGLQIRHGNRIRSTSRVSQPSVC